MVALLSCRKWLSDCGIALVAIDATVDSGHRRAVAGLDVTVETLVDVLLQGLLNLQELLRHVVQRVEPARRVDHELDWQAGHSRQRP